MKIGNSIIGLSVVFLLLLSSCHERMICPAFQSVYLLDTMERFMMFSYFSIDTTESEDGEPNVQYTVDIKKAKNGLVRRIPYKKKKKKLKTVEMVVKYPAPSESADSLATADANINTPNVEDVDGFTPEENNENNDIVQPEEEGDQ